LPPLPRRFERLRSVLNGRMGDLTVLMEAAFNCTRHSARGATSETKKPRSTLKGISSA